MAINTIELHMLIPVDIRHIGMLKGTEGRGRRDNSEEGQLLTSILSLFMQMRKQEDSWGLGVPALKRVGEACVNQRSLNKWYVWMALSMSVWWMPTDTRISMC